MLLYKFNTPLVELMTDVGMPPVALLVNEPELLLENVSFAAKLVAVEVTLNVLHCCITPCLAGMGLMKVFV